MAVKIRLSRIGTINRPFYRLVAVDSRKKRDGSQLANIGTYDPMNGTIVQFHEDIYQEWLSKGALATDSVKKIFKIYKKTTQPTVEPVKTAPKKSKEETVEAE